ncbi:MAG: hypothetical protein NTU97_01095 [Candidatus Magasanikbacteria bacterium]|nr:hypothetical protein [Candidatus Magasanikbacteria bacterium]
MGTQPDELGEFRRTHVTEPQGRFPCLLGCGILLDIAEFFQEEIERFKPLAAYLEGQELSLVLAGPENDGPSLRIFNYVREAFLPNGVTLFLTGIDPATSGSREPGKWIVTFFMRGAVFSPQYLDLGRSSLSLKTSQNTVHTLTNEV